VAAGSALAAVLFAAGAYRETRRQADTAQEALVASTRAYVVLRAEMATDDESKRPYAKITAENMGQTPVYNLFFATRSTSLDTPFERIPDHQRLHVDCAASEGPSSTGLTFGKEETYKVGFAAGAGEERKSVLVHGTACYRDVFGAAHALPVCFLWPLGRGDAVRCRYEGDEAPIGGPLAR
jgi:hypothetical protein